MGILPWWERMEAESLSTRILNRLSRAEAERDEALAQRDRLLEALRQIEVDAKQMKGLGMREEAAETFDLIERTASAAIREGK